MQTSKTILNRVINRNFSEEETNELDNLLRNLQLQELRHILKIDHSIRGVKIA